METQSIPELRKFVAPEFVFGPGSRKLAGRYASNFGGKKILLVSDPGVSKAGWTSEVSDSIRAEGLKAVIFTDVSANPKDYEVMAGTEAYLSEGCDAIVAVGGGSPMDCAKGIGICAANKLHILEFEGVDNVPKPGPPLICIPTTSGTSADVSQFAIITDTKRRVKIAIVSKTAIPDASLIDPETTLTMPNELTAQTGIDALTHAIEAYVSNASMPLTDLVALEAVRLIAEELPRLMTDPDNLASRVKMSQASLFAGLAFSNAILGAVHAMAHSLGGFLDLPHGECNAILLDHVISYNFDAAVSRYLRIAQALGESVLSLKDDNGRRQAVMRAVGRIKKQVGITAKLSDLGVRREHLSELSKKAVADACLATNPKKLDAEDVRKIYESAL